MDEALFRYAIERLNLIKQKPLVGCKICGGESHPFDIVDINKSCDTSQYITEIALIPVIYRICKECRFIFTDFFDEFTSDQWTRYIYNKEYGQFDPEYATIRPQRNALLINSLLTGRKSTLLGLDYGGGNGMTSSLLRQKDWIYDSYDPFGHSDISSDRIGRYNFCSAFEVFEHSPDPVASLREIVEKSSPERLIILISTVPSDGVVTNETRLSWWYAAPRNGHVSLYSRRSLQILTSSFDLTCSLFWGSLLFVTRGYTSNEVRALVLRMRLRNLIRRMFLKK